MNDVAAFYDGLAATYHFNYPDWEASAARQSAALDRMIGEYAAGEVSILDCACGIGTQSIGLVERGHRVVATDIRPAAVTEAVRRLRERGLAAGLAVADMRRLPLGVGQLRCGAVR